MRTLLMTLGLGGLMASAPALAQPASHARTESPRPQSAPDASKPGKPPNPTKLSAEDQEVVENLELLENLEQSDALDLLVELSKED